MTDTPVEGATCVTCPFFAAREKGNYAPVAGWCEVRLPPVVDQWGKSHLTGVRSSAHWCHLHPMIQLHFVRKAIQEEARAKRETKSKVAGRALNL